MRGWDGSMVCLRPAWATKQDYVSIKNTYIHRYIEAVISLIISPLLKCIWVFSRKYHHGHHNHQAPLDLFGKRNVSIVANPVLLGMLAHTQSSGGWHRRGIWDWSGLHCELKDNLGYILCLRKRKKNPSWLLKLPKPLANIWLPRVTRIVVVWGHRDLGSSHRQGLSLPFLQGNLNFTSV